MNQTLLPVTMKNGSLRSAKALPVVLFLLTSGVGSVSNLPQGSVLALMTLVILVRVRRVLERLEILGIALLLIALSVYASNDYVYAAGLAAGVSILALVGEQTELGASRYGVWLGLAASIMFFWYNASSSAQSYFTYVDGGLQEINRRIAAGADANATAIVYLANSAAALWHLKSLNRRVDRGAAYLAILVNGLGVALSGSRSGIACLGLLLLSLLLSSGRTEIKNRRRALGMFAAVLFCGALVAAALRETLLSERFSNFGTDVGERSERWSRGWDQASDSVVGYLFGSPLRDTHNTILELVLMGGLVAALMISVVLGRLCYRACRGIGRSRLLMLLLLGLLPALSISVTLVPSYWLYLGLVMAYLAPSRQELLNGIR